MSIVLTHACIARRTIDAMIITKCVLRDQNEHVNAQRNWSQSCMHRYACKVYRFTTTTTMTTTTTTTMTTTTTTAAAATTTRVRLMHIRQIYGLNS